MATISSYFGAAGGRRPDSDRVILAPTHISPRPNDPDEFKLNGKQYVRYSVMAKSQKHTKKRTPVVWQYGEDIQLKQDPTKRFWYCYLCEQQQRQQGLPISGKGNCTALDHLESKHQIDRETGEHRHAKSHPSQPSTAHPPLYSNADLTSSRNFLFDGSSIVTSPSFKLRTSTFANSSSMYSLA
ncbi:hypothetical protein IWW34DRAFT_418344 [Fusarium oxysporum f. sp. albedinis]|nr:hypothetical protein IWW34DRAFT_418344 [Fusarium oxysporum f. sp. albedinis]KAJ0129510.1 Uncharacterized protein HZ326_27396 [Fusarium oxysporum f. sp. albedinis]